MTTRKAPSLKKWPFLLGDILLLAVAWWIASRSPNPFASWPLLLIVACVGVGAWFCVAPFLSEHKAAMTLAESDALNTVVQRINQLQRVGDQVAQATGQWQEVQERASATASLAQEISERMATEAKAFAEFMQKTQEAEKQHMRLEIEKMRRNEGDWLQVLIILLDNIYALHKAGLRSKKQGLIGQLTNFQHACREAARRLGLVPFEVESGALYDANVHQLADPNTQPAPDARIEDTLAPGYSFQGRPLRKPLVILHPTEDAAPAAGELFSLKSPSPPGSEAAPDHAATAEESGQPTPSATILEEEETKPF